MTYPGTSLSFGAQINLTHLLLLRWYRRNRDKPYDRSVSVRSDLQEMVGPSQQFCLL
ncbi:hypothetical protein SPRG_13797 [Saprolegnia parasitica CBS 223.65]|uniref:Uncharacterized protein n=1 Tax=Saprolegnia parasitica (strain CBS 223.65) TaxID=695850 RepID=A0A067BRF5_SAPPC|nr:hypothetical protein SPRG_13797 [Saprolegnia parasitica CBS 223.65]KDO21089.1 hypothetical protein SPRG_13797 [Saprolegnia parasitica CBS 223.65]|eukprot:XP_012208184.1 hypothetical protein SPRG_13797 [Saprolegnia parasitica CBS 223.65]